MYLKGTVLVVCFLASLVTSLPHAHHSSNFQKRGKLLSPEGHTENDSWLSEQPSHSTDTLIDRSEVSVLLNQRDHAPETPMKHQPFALHSRQPLTGRKTKREVGNGENSPKPNRPPAKRAAEVPGSLPREMLALREEILRTLLAQAGNVDRETVQQIADAAVRRLMQETAALDESGRQSAKSLVRLPPSLLAGESERGLDEAMEERIWEEAYRDRWYNPTARMSFMIEILSRAFPSISEDVLLVFANEAAVVVDEEREALNEVARRDFGMESYLLFDDEGMAMGSLVRQATSEARKNDLSFKELSALLRTQYPPLKTFNRELLARTALYMIDMEERGR